MNKTLITIAIVLAAGFAGAAAFLMPDEPEPSTVLPSSTDAHPFNPSAAMEDRVTALEAAVEAERESRRVLEDELIALYSELERLKKAGTSAQGSETVAAAEESRPPPQLSRFRERDSFEQRSAELVDAGLTAERAAYILQRESELRFAQMQAFYEARNAENPELSLANVQDADAALREEIGEADYEKYLQANNRSTSIEVQGVMSSSPAAAAGLQRGDEIVRYDGERVYNSRDLMERAMDGEGQVVVEVLRDGTTMQVVIPRGPIGIEIGRRRG